MRPFADHIRRISGDQRKGQLPPVHLDQCRFRTHLLAFTGRTDMRHVHFSPYGGRSFGESSRNSEHRRVFHQCHQSRRCQHGQVSRPHRRCEIFRLYDSPAGMFQSFFQHSHFFLMVLHSIAFSRILTKSAAKNNDFVFQSAFCTDRLFSYLCHSFGFAAPNCYGSAIKRESGANPEQTELL